MRGGNAELDTGEAGFSRDIVRVPIASLRAADSPRLNGVDHVHIRTLADMDLSLPPICVHPETMRVIDGMHRLSAARMNGYDEIDVRFFHVSEQDAFRLAVRANVTHGMPLTLADRQAAAARMISTHPELSNRSIAATTGMFPKTVAAVRARGSQSGDSQARIGRDGRVRPLSTAEGRRIGSEAIVARPDASLREIAREAGTSVGTVRDVRARLRAGEDPVPQQHRAGHGDGPRPGDVPRPAPLTRPGKPLLHPEPVDITALLDGLRHDPSLRYTESGRRLLCWLGSRTVTETEWRDACDSIPPHCGTAIALIARECGRVWLELADEPDGWSSGCA